MNELFFARKTRKTPMIERGIGNGFKFIRKILIEIFKVITTYLIQNLNLIH